MKAGILFAVLATVLVSSCVNAAGSGEPSPRYGQLRVSGTQLLSENGEAVQLRGISTMGLQWYGGVVNEAAFTALARDWEADVVRLALYIGENGYATDPGLEDLVVNGVELAIDLGMYAIIDWHVLTPGNPNDPVYAGADEFFDEMSRRFGAHPNVIYEIMNEPNGALSWSEDLKPYAQRIVSVIRENDPDNIILIGSGTWSQDVDIAAADPVEGENLMYTVHFYAGTHGDELRAKIRSALGSGAAVFASEWGTSQASGTGGPYIDAAEEWLSFFDELGISWVNWSLCNKNETSAALNGLVQVFVPGEGTVVRQEEAPLVPDAEGPDGYPVWTDGQLSVSGAYVRAKIKGIEAPLYTVELAGWDFESGDLGGWHAAEDGGAVPELSIADAESSALAFSAAWTTAPTADAWATAPRIKLADTGVGIGPDTVLSFDVYLEEEKIGSRPIEITPVLQYPPTWWRQLQPVRITDRDGEPAGSGLVRTRIEVSLDAEPGTELAHLVIIVAGAASGYEGTVYLDDIALSDRTNGDASDAEALPVDDPGEFAGLPWDFETGTREGWTVADDSPALVQLGIVEAESAALGFEFGWSVPGPEDPWNAAPRISSSWVNLDAAAYRTLALDLYLREGGASGGVIQVQPVIQSPEHGYWFQLVPVDVDPLAATAAANGLLKFALEVPLVSNTGRSFVPGDVLRNLILITIGMETDYEGPIVYDNIELR